MKKFGCWLGLILLLLAAASALAEVVMQAQGTPVTISIGWIWYQIHGNSLVGFQALIEKRISPALWPPIQSLLTWQLWLVLGVPGVLLALCCLGLRRRNETER
jgi:hypothetical protein